MGGLQYAALIIPVLMLLVVLEYWIARKKGVDAFSFSDTIVNMCCGMLERLFDVFWVVMMYFVFGFLFDKIALWQIPSNGFTFILALLFADFMAYWHHRLSHEINFLWAAHIVHHQSEELNVTTVFRVSAFAVINRSFFFIWLPLLGFSPELTTGAIVFIGLFQFLTHTRLVGKLGFLEYFMVTPSHHRVHHARNEKYLDKNYGHVFIIWDKMLGTFAPEEEEPDYGITTGFESANPYRAYLWYWKDLFRRAGETNRFIDKIRVFTKPPSWNPEDVQVTPSEFRVDAAGKRKKYRLQLPFRLQLYVLVQTIATLGAFLGIMVLKNTLEHPSVVDLLTDLTIIRLAVIVMVSVMAFGALMERKRWAVQYEQVRLGFLALMSAWILWGESIAIWALPVIAVYLVISWVWLMRLRNYFGMSEDDFDGKNEAPETKKASAKAEKAIA